MSFGFSIGDIILLSQLAYGLYSSISSGRKAASRDLKELEDVLFSLKCSLDHLGEVSKDVLAQPDRHGGPMFKEKLDAMIRNCASTLHELESVTEKYRMIEGRAVEQATGNKEKTKSRTLDDVRKSIQVNWYRVRWDNEKQSLQQYREKLKSHTDAINLILTSAIWANSASADERSRQGHEKTHTLLEEVLRKPEADASLRSIVEDIRNILTEPNRSARGLLDSAPVPVPMSSSPVIAAYQLSPSPIGGSFGVVGNQAGRFASVNMATTVLPIRPSIDPVRVRSVARATETPYLKRQRVEKIRIRQPNVVGQGDIPSATDDLNAMRRAVGVREYEAFKQRHTPPKQVQKPSFLKPIAPTIQELRDCIPYIFASLPDGKQQTQELRSEIERWAQGFSLFVRNNKPDTESDAGLLALLTRLNEAVEKSAKSVRRLFYEVSDSIGLLETLDKVMMVSKSVRVMKEIEEFQDAKEEWEDDRSGN
ncbi:hypothetical protein yc1106_03905 [Curvularia clavata]|uniref:Fungal N-terminal domain-containing protein n=1 Tax=Curvularia clavata TaxID=95742 RepID=A0A9Q8Z5C9_CURCL|nr:hypothetical protein yc1106_03905 [Curvularia clavata]